MPTTPNPVELLEPWAVAGIRDAIPEAPPGTPGRASLQAGFPPETMQPIVAGGIPPFGQDMNGILYMMSSHTVFLQSGQPYKFSSTVAASLGGYAAGTILGMADGSGLWINQTDGNSTNPDTDPTAVDGWIPLYSYGISVVAGLTGGVATLTKAQASRPVIRLQGALVGNLQVVVPNTLQTWLIANETSGGFTVTVKTAAGTGVNIPAGGLSQPTGVYGDGINIYGTAAPLPVSISQAADPSTIAERTSAGYLLAVFFNMGGPQQNFGLTSVFAEAANDGYIRKISPANFAAQLALSSFAGQVSAGQVPLAAVIQYAASLWASPALTGTPTGPTAAIGSQTAQLATTAFVNRDQLKAPTGYIEFANGIILQWGYSQGAGGIGTLAINFPKVFPNACWAAVCSCNRSVGGASDGSNFVSSLTQNGFVAFFDQQNNGLRGGYWFAVGN